MKRIILMLAMTMVCQTVTAGIVVTYKDAESGEQRQEFYEGGKANLSGMIYTGKHFVVVDQATRTYWKGTPDQYCKGLQAMKKKMEAQMASMPAMYRPVPISQKKVTRKKIGKQNIAGFSATGYEFSVDGSPSDRVWVSSDSGLADIIKFERSMLKKWRCLDGLSNMSLEGADIYKQTVEGKFVLKESFQQVYKVEKKSIPASIFKTPSGYKSFSNYERYMDYLMNASGADSGDSSMQYESEYNMPSEMNDQRTQRDNVIVEDAKDIANDAVNQAHSSTKRGIQDEISKDVEKSVKGLLDKLF